MHISEVSEKYDISPDTLRYDEKVGLLPPVHRSKSGLRDYDENDLAWIDFIKCMRSAGLSIEKQLDRRIARSYQHLIALILAATLMAACGAAPTPSLSPATGLPPPGVTVGVPTTMLPPTVTPGTVPPTATLMPAAQPSPQPTDEGTPMPASQPPMDETPIRVMIGDTVLTGRLSDNATARDLIAQLPLTLSFRDFGGQEKLAPLPRKLSMEGVPAGSGAGPRDIGYYAPDGVVVFYYRDVGYFNGIVRIGQFDGNMDAITSQTGDFTARIELLPFDQ